MMTRASEEEKFLSLPDGRTLAYAEAGDPHSSDVLIFFHGTFGVGESASASSVVLEKGFHCVAPTLPGWGNTSPVPHGTPYNLCIISDITALVQHLHPDDPNLKLYYGGGSFGTVPAQMLYGAPYVDFPLGRHTHGMILIVPFSPFQCDKHYSHAFPWMTYIGIGAPAHYVPFKLIPRIAKAHLEKKLNSVEHAETFLRHSMFDKMGDVEREAYAQWREAKGMEEGELERRIAKDMSRSVASSWDGFMDMPEVLRSDWGFCVSDLDKEHSKAPIFVVSSTHDDMIPDTMASFLAANYTNVRVKSLDGGHMVALFHADEIWTEFMEMVQPP
ncbi:hypothetical protein JAAARDRAFT_202017 [Jaapia argillacea MUCL 33604]|uniref:AB hydrolase-1 domain-containing protein n=1 Tax=Jaapia argillacea MUCL 33604 TaxID=933084 RepID=A0A067QCM2_9AGAM|nr:hypothetical protein JAAARDRAFT_202017 [Jaapia argillacea MUCL 33604]